MEFGSAKRKERKWRKKEVNPTTGHVYYEEVKAPKLKDTSAAPETPPAPKVPAQRPTGEWNPDIDTGNQDWTDK